MDDGRRAEQGATYRLRTRARIAAHVIWDHAVRPAAVDAGDVPWSADAASPAWLTAMLCGAHPGARVEQVTVDGGSDGSSVRRRMTLRYNPEGERRGLPAHLFVKSTPGLLTRLTAGQVARREAAFFRRIRPELAIEAPVHHGSAFDSRSGRSLHIFEDLTVTRGASFCSDRTAITRAHADTMIDLLATLHGSFHDSPRFATDLDWLDSYEGYLTISARNGSRNGHERAMTIAAPAIPPAVTARRDEIWPMLMAGLAAHRDEPPTLLHSDVHLGNWYIAGDGRMGLCDWALVCRGHWARDLAYALATTLATEDRRAWERDLVTRYLARLKAAGGPDLGFDHGWLRYRQQMFAALLMWTPTLCPSPTRPEMQTEAMSLTMIGRITAAIDDLGSLDSQGNAA